MISEKTVCLEHDHSAAEEKLRLIADKVAKFFLLANNKNTFDFVDLDPRDGYVRLARTKTRRLIGFGVTHIQGQMNPSGKLQAILTQDGVDSVLTLDQYGGQISWGYDCQGRLCEQSVEQTSLGMQNYKAEIVQAL